MSIYVQPETVGDMGYDEIRTCPYDPSHRISAVRFTKHLIKCQKNHPNAKMSRCPFNASHVIPDEEYSTHCSICPDKGWIECQQDLAANIGMNSSASTNYEASFPKQTSDISNVYSNEDWDQDMFEDSSANKSFQITNRMCKTMELTSAFKMKMLQSIAIEASEVNRRPTNKPRALPLAGIGRGRVVSNRAANVGQQKFDKPLASKLTNVKTAVNKMTYPAPAFFCQDKVKFPDGGCDRNSNKRVISKTLPLTDSMVSGSTAAVKEKKEPAAAVEEKKEPAAAVEEKKEPAVEDRIKEQKTKRKLEKLIRQIVKIEEKQKAGVELNEDEKKKLKKKIDLQQLIEGV